MALVRLIEALAEQRDLALKNFHAADAGSLPELAHELAYDVLHDRVERLVDELRDSDEEREWDVREEDQAYTTIFASSAQEALEAAKDNVDRSNYDGAEGTLYIDVAVRCVLTDEEASATVTLEPEAPECSAAEHDWQAPYEVVGGIEENPGVWGHGGGVIMRRVCAHCGIYCVTDTWAQRHDTGEQGLTEVKYEDADDESLGWIRQRALRAAREIGCKDARAWMDETPDRSDWRAAIAPGQPDADESLINALGSKKVAELFGVDADSDAFSEACRDYSRAWSETVEEELAE